MSRFICSIAAAFVAVSSSAWAQTTSEGFEPIVIKAKDFAELSQKFCAADPNANTVLILPAALFVDSQQVICENGPYKLYRVLDATDADDFEYFLDPPFGSQKKLGCDGKAGKKMPVVAVNCRPL